MGEQLNPKGAIAGNSVAFSCSGKKSYLTRAGAAKDAARVCRTNIGQVSVYRCRYCHMWHLGSVAVPKDGFRKKKLSPSDRRQLCYRVLRTED